MHGKLNSAVGYKGLLKKIGILCVVALAHIVGKTVGVIEIRSIVIGFYIANEGISILENIGNMGVRFPKALKKILEQLDDKSNGGGDNEPNT